MNKKERNTQNKTKETKKGLKSEQPEFEQKMVDLARVTRVTKGGKQLSFRALVVIGNKRGQVGYGLAKGRDVTLAVGKAVDKARKQLITIPRVNGTITHEIYYKFGAARIMLKPAPQGTGVKAGGAIRTVLDLAGVDNAVGKIMGTANKINNVKCVCEALKKLREPRVVRKNKEDNKNNLS